MGLVAGNKIEYRLVFVGLAQTVLTGTTRELHDKRKLSLLHVHDVWCRHSGENINFSYIFNWRVKYICKTEIMLDRQYSTVMS